MGKGPPLVPFPLVVCRRFPLGGFIHVRGFIPSIQSSTAAAASSADAAELATGWAFLFDQFARDRCRATDRMAGGQTIIRFEAVSLTATAYKYIYIRQASKKDTSGGIKETYPTPIFRWVLPW